GGVDQPACAQSLRLDLRTGLAHGPLRAFQQPRAVAGLALAVSRLLLSRLALRAVQLAPAQRTPRTPARRDRRRHGVARAGGGATVGPRREISPQGKASIRPGLSEVARPAR